jgi:hypothetical protein
VVSGLWTNRWAPARDLEAAAARLALTPETVGDWDARPREMSEREKEGAQVNGAILRDYVNRKTGSTVSLMLLCGRPGPLAVHTPDVCYRGSGFEEVGAPARPAVPPGGADHFWVRRFQKQAAVPVQLRVWYAWSATGEWEAADNPRVHFARQPVLFKLYVIRELPRADEPLEDDAANEFLRTLLPQLGPKLFPAASDAG